MHIETQPPPDKQPSATHIVSLLEDGAIRAPEEGDGGRGVASQAAIQVTRLQLSHTHVGEVLYAGLHCRF